VNTSKLNNWIQNLTSAAVFIGLVLVALEIRETNAIAEDQALSEFWTNWIALSTPDYSTDVGAAYIKAINNAQDLSDEEMFKLGSWLTAAMSTYGQLFLMHQQGRVSDDYRSELAGDVEFYFGNNFGRAWYAENKSWMLPEMVEVIDEQLKGNPDLDSRDYWMRIRDQL
jgi:hypothetical protein